MLADDPELTVRLAKGRNPLRVVLDARLRTPAASKLARVGRGRRTLIFHGPDAPEAKRKKLAARGVELCEVPVDGQGRLALRRVLSVLYRRDIVRLLVEGGSEVHGAFLDARLADRAALFVAPKILGDGEALPFARGQRARRQIADALELRSPTVRRLGPDLFVEGELGGQLARHTRRDAARARV